MPSAATDTTRAPLDSVIDVLVDALRALGADGRPDDANRLAGRAYVALRREHPDRAQRINAVMHGLARMPTTNQENR